MTADVDRRLAGDYEEFLAAHAAEQRGVGQGDLRRASARSATALAGQGAVRPEDRRQRDRRRPKALEDTRSATARDEMPAVGKDWTDDADRRRCSAYLKRSGFEWRLGPRCSPYRADWKRGTRRRLDHDRRPQADRDPLHRHEPRLLRARRDPRAADARAARDAERALRDEGQLQRAVHDARHDDDLPRRRPDPRRLRQLPRAADDRRPRHGLPAAERLLLLDVRCSAGSCSTRASSRTAAPPKCGWTCYAPLSENAYSPGHGIDLWILSLHLLTIASLAGAINFIATIHNMRAPGMSWMRHAALRLGDPDLRGHARRSCCRRSSAGLTLLLLDRQVGTHFFIPDKGGSALLWQHVFWFFGHPEVYIMILPAMGIVSEIIPVFSRKPIFGYKAIAFSTLGIAFVSMLVWAHHMFAVGLPWGLQAFFMISSMAVAVPTGVKIFNWLATTWRGNLIFDTPMLFALGFIAVFTIGGLSGIFLAAFPVDWQLTDTYYVVAHLHYVLFGGSIFGIFAGLHYWWPKMFGRLLDERLGKWTFWLMFIGFNVTFFPQHMLGLLGMPRRVYTYDHGGLWEAYNLTSTIGSGIMTLGILRLPRQRRFGRRGAARGPATTRGSPTRSSGSPRRRRRPRTSTSRCRT